MLAFQVYSCSVVDISPQLRRKTWAATLQVFVRTLQVFVRTLVQVFVSTLVQVFVRTLVHARGRLAVRRQLPLCLRSTILRFVASCPRNVCVHQISVCFVECLLDCHIASTAVQQS